MLLVSLAALGRALAASLALFVKLATANSRFADYCSLIEIGRASCRERV